jgi:prolipoprotein diacylglyceryltransferase
MPTLALFALVGGWLGLSVAARTGARQNIDPDQTLTAGMSAVLAGLIVARLWSVVQFWEIYQQDPLLAFSPRPGGLALWPGVFAAIIAGYAYLLRARMQPGPVAAAMSVGFLVTLSLVQIGAFLSGNVVGQASDLPWAVNYFGSSVHPVGIYRAVGYFAVAGLLYWQSRHGPGWPTVLQGVLGYGVVRLLADAYLANPGVIAGLRAEQVTGLVLALVAALLLARTANRN